ncbi:hypothetical protein GALMADRAFT_256051 [Galerina marginata CBS 339.88]|uniref:ABC transporter domain-containing protein n=1 Tax=Galerina marginata (strain CBS 339.88) TaxID=685588 RepID=A0A067SQZ3_GALM3|nr:hypothetical protein GALMADRAFT_256051 [Galerina marginata CBS 339.88]
MTRKFASLHHILWGLFLTPMSPENEKKPTSTSEAEKVAFEELQLGVWYLKFTSGDSLDPRKHWDDLKSALPLFRRLTTEIFSVAPGLFTIYILCLVWQGVEDSLLMHLSNQLLRTVESGVILGKPDSKKIINAVFSRLACTVFVSYLNWYGEKVHDLLRSHVTRHFDLVLMNANLRVDLPTSQEAGSKQEASGRQAWSALERILSFQTDLLRTISQIILITTLSRSTGGPLFALVCVSQPIFSVFFGRSLWDKVCFGFVNNKHYQKMKALQKLAGGTFRQDIISGGLSQWITKEFQQEHQSLGHLSDSHPYQQYNTTESPFFSVVTKVLGDLPMVFCALNAIMEPTKFSVASIAILQQSSSTLRQSVSMALYASQQFRKSVAAVKTIYASTAVINSMTVGDTSYPRIDEKSDSTNGSKGMGFKLNAVSFSYPGSQATSPSLKEITINIDPGQVVVIVGANGSGKSTLIRILSRLYDPTSGKVLIDGLPSADYRIDDLHEATALLSQDNTIYPLSLGENIGLGYPERVLDDEMVTEAAEKGGALEVINKLKDGKETVLDPIVDVFQVNLYGNKTHPLYEEMEKLRKKIDISGGETQRVVAARTFMRFNSGKVKFVAVDEPSSALDAEAELKLFENLLAVREGKTMVFVTHRFGHLTRHANLILCMKDGAIVERGSHIELMEMKGEYANLYEIQARAFSNP